MIGFGNIQLAGGGGGSGAQTQMEITCVDGNKEFLLPSGLIVQGAFFNKVLMFEEEFSFVDGLFTILIPNSVTTGDTLTLIIG